MDGDAAAQKAPEQTSFPGRFNHEAGGFLHGEQCGETGGGIATDQHVALVVLLLCSKCHACRGFGKTPIIHVFGIYHIWMYTIY